LRLRFNGCKEVSKAFRAHDANRFCVIGTVRDPFSCSRRITGILYSDAVIHAAKDMISSKAAKAWLNNFIARYGEVREFKIDSKRKRIDLSCILNGETEPVRVTIIKYEVEDEGEKTFFKVIDSSATRPWLQAVMRDHLHGQRFELPKWASTALG
jgi:hypothetical protein